MSELKPYTYDDMIDGDADTNIEYYPKSEADKVIAELKDDVTYWKKVAKKNMDDNVAMARERAKAFESEHRRKYKQCMAMAEWCNSEMGRETFACFRPRGTKELWREEHNYWSKWRKIWFELAQKFKESV